MRHGKGKIFSINGYTFEGRFLKDKKNGPGVVHDTDGNVFHEVWDKGELIDRDLTS
jgi:hypothetical protein